uniref:RNA-directed DNA polymerase n=1 Tax=Tanacetum cinerariifolium TaxID=118510 RepID=A0A6L2L4F6_TANCI|nr:RNA-directed DNA polymerase [Tanacetum cinerariifolium]
METRGRKKFVAEPALPARDPCDDDKPVDVNPFSRENPRLGLKIEIPEFTGKVHLDDFIDWLSTVERFDVRDIPNKLKVKPVAIKLRQLALLWWDHVNKRRQIKGKSKIKAKKKGSTSRFTPPTRTASPIAPKATTFATSTACTTKERVDNASHCYKCGGLGHYARDYPNLKTLAFVPDDACPIYDINAEPELDESGHPWQFDRKTKHDGFQNTYSFKKDDVNITLVPFDSHQTHAKENEIISEAPLQVQALLREFADVIPNDMPPGLPAMRDIQHCINFIPGSAIPTRPAYRMNTKEFAKLQRQVTELLEKGLIRESMSPCAILALLVPKYGGPFRICIDSRVVNKITIKYRFLISRLDDLLNWLHGSTIFYKTYLRSVYHQIRMRPGDEWKTTFKTRDGISLEQHLSHLRQIFSVLRAQKLYASGKKCHFLVTEVTFLGYIVTGSGIKIDPTKVEGGRFTWKSEAAKAFDILKAKVTEAPVLALPNFNEVFQALKFINGQHKLKPRHAKWVEFIQAFSFVIRHKVRSDNQVADALSRRHSLITTMQIRVQGFDSFRGLYCDDLDFREIWSKSDSGPFQQFSKLDGYLFKGVRLCIPLCYLRKAIILEGHAGGLAGYFGLLERCRTCHIAKTHSSNAGLYIPLSVPIAPWEDVSLDFVLGLHRTQRAKDSVMFVSHFWHTLWPRLGSKLQFSSSHHPQTDGQNEVVNRSLGNLLRSLIGDNAKQWDLILPQAEFAYNRSVNRTTGKSPFEVVYGRNPITHLDLVHVPEVGQFSKKGADQSEQIKELHRAFGKLKPRGDGPFRVLKKIDDNAYKIEILGHYNISATFNIADLSPYKGDNTIKVLEDGDLQTLGLMDYDKRLSHTFTAHPKIDSVTAPPYVTWVGR